MVGIDNDAANRIPEYLPPNDSYEGVPGRADAYASFVIDNVRPYLDATYRTLNSPPDTLTVGSSLGGLVALYLGREYSTFGKIGVLSPALWIAPNYVAQVAGGIKKPLRVYLDMGTAESASDWNNTVSLYDVHLAQGYAPNDDLRFVAGCGQAHNEAAWAARLPAALQYLLPAREEPALLAQRDFPPTLTITSIDFATQSAVFSYTSLYGFSYGPERSTDLLNWSVLPPAPAESLPWSIRTIDDASFPDGNTNLWRLCSSVPP